MRRRRYSGRLSYLSRSSYKLNSNEANHKIPPRQKPVRKNRSKQLQKTVTENGITLFVRTNNLESNFEHVHKLRSL